MIFFSKKIFFEKRKKINVFWKQNKIKGGNEGYRVKANFPLVAPGPAGGVPSVGGGNKNALQSDRNRYTAKKLHYNLNFSFNPLFL